MVDEFKSIRDSLVRTLANLSVTTKDAFDADDGTAEEDTAGAAGGSDARAARALIGALFAKAGRSKDEIVQIVAREIGLTVAAMLKEPLSQIAKHQKLQISFELVPKDESSEKASTGPHHSPKMRRKRHITKHSSHRHKVGKSGA